MFSALNKQTEKPDTLSLSIQVASSKILACMSKKALYVKIKEMCLCLKTSHKSTLLGSKRTHVLPILGFILPMINCASNHLHPK